MRRLATALSLVGLLLSSGCKPAVRLDPAPEPPPYEELAQRYNERLDKLDRFFSRAVVGMTWIDAQGRRTREQGEGHVQFVRYDDDEIRGAEEIRSPARVALNVGKVGNIGYWLGCDATRFWWVDAHEEQTAYVAHHKNFGKDCCESAGIPLHPIELINLLALDKLDLEALPISIEASERRPVWKLTRLTSFGPERLTIDSRTLHPERVELLDALGVAVVTAELTEYQPVEITDLPPPLWPRLPRRVVIEDAQGTTQITLTLSEPFDARRDPRKLRDAAFTFETVARGLGVRRIVVLDADCLDDDAQPSAGAAGAVGD